MATVSYLTRDERQYRKCVLGVRSYISRIGQMQYSKLSMQRRAIQVFKRWILLAGWIVVSSPLAHGAEWSLNPSVQAKTSYNSNIYVSASNPISLWGATVSPMLNASRRTANSGISLVGRAIFTKYSKKLAKNPNAQYVTLASYYNTLLNNWRLNGYYRRDTTSTKVTEVQTVDSTDGGTGPSVVNINLVPVEVRQNDLSLQPSWEHRLTELTHLTLSYSFDDVFYDNTTGTSLSDYQQHGVSAGVGHVLTEKDTVGVLATAKAFRASSSDHKADVYGAQLTYEHAYSQTLRGTLRVGGRFVSSTVGNQTDDTSGLLLTATLNKKYSELTSYRFILERSVLPSGAGTVVQADHLNAAMFRTLSSRLNFALWGRVFNEESINTNTSNVNRVYISVEPSLRYLLTRFWSIDGSYQYRWQKYSDQSSSGEDHGVFVSINYGWPRMAVSR